MRRRSVLALAAAVVLVAGWFVYRDLYPPGPLATWPQVPAEGRVNVTPPPLRIPPAECFEEESHRVLLRWDYERGGEVRFSYPPADGGPRVRDLPETGSFFFPGIGEGWLDRAFEALGLAGRTPEDPAVLVAFPDEHWLLLPPREFFGAVRIYLGGATEDGKIGAIPFVVWRAGLRPRHSLAANGPLTVLGRMSLGGGGPGHRSRGRVARCTRPGRTRWTTAMCVRRQSARAGAHGGAPSRRRRASSRDARNDFRLLGS